MLLLGSLPAYKERGTSVQHRNGQKTDLGPTWQDVKEGMEELLTLYEGYVSIEFTLAPARAGAQYNALWARVVWRDAPGTPGSPERASGGSWPHPDHKTMPSLLHKHIIWLERKLESLAHDRAMEEHRAACAEVQTKMNL